VFLFDYQFLVMPKKCTIHRLLLIYQDETITLHAIVNVHVYFIQANTQ